MTTTIISFFIFASYPPKLVPTCSGGLPTLGEAINGPILIWLKLLKTKEYIAEAGDQYAPCRWWFSARAGLQWICPVLFKTLRLGVKCSALSARFSPLLVLWAIFLIDKIDSHDILDGEPSGREAEGKSRESRQRGGATHQGGQEAVAAGSKRLLKAEWCWPFSGCDEKKQDRSLPLYTRKQIS